MMNAVLILVMQGDAVRVLPVAALGLGTGKLTEGACLLAANEGQERKIGNEKGSAWNQPRFKAEWRWVCGMPGVTERLVGSSPSVCGVWAHRML